VTPTNLISRLREATGGSRELDLLLFQHFDPEACEAAWWRARPGDDVSAFMDKDAQKDFATEHQERPAYTSSLDAALELVERALPGCGWCVDHEADCKTGEPVFGAHVNGYIGPEGPEGATWAWHDAKAPTPPLALLLALMMGLEE